MFLPTDRSVRTDDLAVEAEARGFESLWIGDHSHIPADRVSEFPLKCALPEEYYRTVDSFVALGAAAVRTTTLLLGTCIYLVAQRDPINTAKQVASVDLLSGGRFRFGIGNGWNAEEAAHHGVEWSTRRARIREYVLAMKELWTQDEATFHGEFVSFDRACMWPKPVSKPYPPVMLGAGPGPRNFDAIAEWGDGWFPVPFFGHTPDDVEALRRHVAERGRDPSTISINVDGVLPRRELLDLWAGADVDRVLIPLPSEPMDEILPVLDAATPFVAEYR